MLWYHGLAHLRPLCGPKVFLLIHRHPPGIQSRAPKAGYTWSKAPVVLGPERSPSASGLPLGGAHDVGATSAVVARPLPGPTPPDLKGAVAASPPCQPTVPRPASHLSRTKWAGRFFLANHLGTAHFPVINPDFPSCRPSHSVHEFYRHSQEATVALHLLSGWPDPVDDQRRLRSRWSRGYRLNPAPEPRVNPLIKNTSRCDATDSVLLRPQRTLLADGIGSVPVLAYRSGTTRVPSVQAQQKSSTAKDSRS